MKKIKTIVQSFAVGILLTGCATTSMNKVTEYEANKLSHQQIKEFQSFVKEVNELDPFYYMAFNEEQSLLSITIKAPPGKRFLRGSMAKKYLQAVCNSEDPFYKMVRSTGVGVEYELIDPRVSHKFGPWNIDACW